MDNQETIDIDKSELLNHVQQMKNEGYRLAQICATKLDGFILLYSFANEERFVNYRICMEPSDAVKSISWLYSYAFLYENEMKDLFGVNVEDMTLDFKGNLYKTSIPTPFNPVEGGNADG